MTDNVTPVQPVPDAPVVETPKKRKFVPTLPTVKKAAKYTLMGVGAFAIASKANDLLNKDVTIDINAEVTDSDETTENA